MKMHWVLGAVFSAATMLGSSTTLYAQDVTRSIWDGVYSSAQADRGKTAYSSNCEKCHAGSLDGMDEIPGLKGPHFIADWETQTVAELVTRIRSTMPIDNPGALSTATVTDVVAYLLQQNQMPAGSAELSPDAGMAGQIRINAVKQAAK